MKAYCKLQEADVWRTEQGMRANTAAPANRRAGTTLSADPTEVEHFNNNDDIGSQVFVREYEM